MRIALLCFLLLPVLLSGCSATTEENRSIQLDASALLTTRLIGRHDNSGDYPKSAWSGTGAQTRVTGTELSVRLNGAAGVYFYVVVDGEPISTFVTAGGVSVYQLAQWNEAGTHEVQIYRRNEGSYGVVGFLGFTSSGTLEAPADEITRRIEYLGDSLTCGYGIEGDSAYCDGTAANENAWFTYAGVASRSVSAQAHLICQSGKGVGRNSDGTANDTMPALYNRTLATDSAPLWDFTSWSADVVVINLGTNDLYGGATADEFVAAYRTLIGTIRTHYPGAMIVAITWEGWGEEMESWVTQAISESADGNIEQLRFVVDEEDGYGCVSHTNVTTNEKLGAQLASMLRERLSW